MLKAGAQLGLMTSALALPNVSMGQSTPPNILWISIDDLNDWVAPLGGYSLVKTPNITRLARLRTGVHQANVPVCSGSRAATLFGFQPYTTGGYTNEELWHRNPFLTSRASVVKFFKNQNYFTVGTGKVYHSYLRRNSRHRSRCLDRVSVLWADRRMSH